MARIRPSSLRIRLLGLVLLAIIPAFALILYTALEQRRAAALTAHQDALRLARTAVAEQQEGVREAQQLLRVLAALPEVRAHDGDACNALFANLLSRDSRYVNVVASTPDGEVFCSALPLPGPVNLARRSHFRRAVETRDFVVGEYQIGGSTSAPRITFGYPALDGTGEVQAVVTASLELSWLGRLASGLPEGSTLLALDRSGLVLARYPNADGWVGRVASDMPIFRMALAPRGAGASKTFGRDGTGRLVALASLPAVRYAGDLYVTVAIPPDVAFADANRIFLRNVAWLGLVSVLALAAAWVGGDVFILRRVNGLARAAERLSTGDLSARVGVGGSDELGAMARTFNEMAGRLEALVEAEHQAQEMGELLQVCVTVEEAHAVIDRLIRPFFPNDRGVLFVVRDSRDVVEPVTHWGPALAGDASEFGPGECWALRRGRPHLVTNPATALLCRHLPAPVPSACICVPLLAQGEALGVLYLSRPAGGQTQWTGLTDVRRRLAVAVADQLALALANLKLRDTLRSQSIRDPLTGLFNRRYMEETLERELRRAARSKHAVGAIMLDIDHFKDANDTFGHDMGDAVLRELGSLLSSSSRGSDIACRYGGEEFVLLLPEASLDDTRRRAEQLRQGVRHLRAARRGRPVGSLTLSLGVAVFPDHGNTAGALLRAADEALYRAKDAGRDRVETAEWSQGADTRVVS